MLGAIIGDIVGSRFEFDNILSKDFDFFHKDCRATDDTAMTLAIGLSFIYDENEIPIGDRATYYMRGVANRYYDFKKGSNAPIGGYGGRFIEWLFGDIDEPYNSCGNGSAMRISAVPYVAKSVEECIALSKAVTEVTHNHIEGIKGAESVAVAIYLLRNGVNRDDVMEIIAKKYYPILNETNFVVDKIRENYEHSELCQKSVPQAFQCFFESVSFEDAIRNAVSIGGDSDTIACISGALAEAYFGVPKEIVEEMQKYNYLDNFQKEVINAFYDKYVK